MEHLHHFGLKQDPFQNEPDLRFYYEGASHTAPQRRIERGLRQYKGLCVLSGEGGTGKSLLTRRLLENLEEEIFDAQLMLMMPGATGANSVLNRYARMVGVESVQQDRPTLLAQIYERLAMTREEGRHCVLMLDDAHLFSREALAEIGGLLSLEYEDRRLVSLVLVGLPELDVTISQQPSIGQRVDVRTRLEPLDEKGSTEYLLHRLACASGDPATLTTEALSALYKFGRGRPRLLNTLADNALFEAYLANRNQLGSEDVERAAADLGIGLDPGSTYSSVPAPSTPSVFVPAKSPVTDSEPVKKVERKLGPPVTTVSAKATKREEVAKPALGPQSFDADDLDFERALVSPDFMASDVASANDPGLDLGDLLSDLGPDTELTTVIGMNTMDPVANPAPDDFDSAVDEMFGADLSPDARPMFEGVDALPMLEGDSGVDFEDIEAFPGLEGERGIDFNGLEALPLLEGESGSDFGNVEATRVAFEDEIPAAQIADAGNELDDLFVELIDE